MQLDSTRIAGAVYHLAATHLPGNTTLNELRVLTQLSSDYSAGIFSTLRGIVTATGISRSTVSRFLIELQSMGVLCEQNDPDDKRRKLLRFSGAAGACNLTWAADLQSMLRGIRPPHSLKAPPAAAPAAGRPPGE